MMNSFHPQLSPFYPSSPFMPGIPALQLCLYRRVTRLPKVAKVARGLHRSLVRGEDLHGHAHFPARDARILVRVVELLQDDADLRRRALAILHTDHLAVLQFHSLRRETVQQVAL